MTILHSIKDYTENENDESEDQDEDFAEEETKEGELAYIEEYILSDDHNPVNEEQDSPIQEYQEEIEILGVNQITDKESTVSNVRRS